MDFMNNHGAGGGGWNWRYWTGSAWSSPVASLQESGAWTMTGFVTAQGGYMDTGNLGSARSGVTSSGTDAALAFINTSTGGLTYWWDSGGSGAGIGEGNFAVYSPGAAVNVPFGMNATTGKVYTTKNVLDDGSGDAEFAGTGAFAGNVTAPTFVGALSGNASTASSLGKTIEVEITRWAPANANSSPIGEVIIGLASSNATYYFEADIDVASGSNAASASLYDATSSATVATTPTTLNGVVRSPAFVPTAGHVYYVNLNNGANDTTYVYSSRVVAQI